MKKTIIAVVVTIISMAAILAAGFGINRMVQQKKEAEWEAAREVRIVEVNESYESIQAAITEVSKLSTDEIRSYIEENTEVERSAPVVISEDYVDPWAENTETSQETSDEETAEVSSDFEEKSVDPEEESYVSEESWEAGSSEENVDRVARLGELAVKALNATVSGNDAESAEVEETEEAETEETEETTEPRETAENEEAGAEDEEEPESEETVEETVSGNSVSGNSVSGNSVSSNDLSGGHQSDGSDDPTLEERQALRTSYEETQLWIEADEKVLERNPFDFSDKKIVCLGDSITAASNLIDEEGYEQYTYPSRLKEILGAESVINLGIGGSSLGRYWDQAFCERYQEIPEDTDIIIIMGGDNDGYCLHEDMVGNLENREYRTLYGDTDELMRGLKENYPEADVFIMTEMPNLLHDVLRKERPELLPQTVVTDCVTELAKEYGFNLIDNYNSNFFDSHDADIVAEYIPDSVHPNEEGYEVFAKHVAAEMIRTYESQDPDVTYIDEDSESSEDETESSEDATESSGDETESSGDEQESSEDESDSFEEVIGNVETEDVEETTENPEQNSSPDEKNEEEGKSKTIFFGRDD